jgi:phenylacetate-coenzyme A ligase PaaK-like adenylate-forming protein
MEYLDKLFAIEDAFCSKDECKHIFFMATKEVFEFHYKNNQIYKKVCDGEGFVPDDLKQYEDLNNIPHIMVNVLKWYDLKTLPDDKIAYEFTSSGTSGQKSHILWDESSRERQSLMRERVAQAVGIPDNKPVNYIVFSYDPKVADSKGAAYAHDQYTHFAPAKNKFYAINNNNLRGVVRFDEEGLLKKLDEYAKDKDTPVRFIGFPAFMHETVLFLKDLGRSFEFHKDSMVITAGGWKDKEDKKISVDEFKNEMYERFGIAKNRFRDIYGFVEHGVPYITCSEGHFHIPIYSLAFARKPGSLEFLENGQKGLLHFLSPYNIAQPTISILSTDYGIVKDGCGCGIDRPYLELLGRAGKQKHKGCAITAGELLKEA